MNQPDFERAKQYALERLERELPPTLCYHSIAHTRDDVEPAVERLAALEGVTGEDLVLLLTAAFYHDIGFVVQRSNHEAIGAQIAAEVLPQLGFTPDQIRIIGDIIMVTRLPQTPHNLLEEIMADADLDVLGRDDFFDINQKLRAELELAGWRLTDEEWYTEQLALMQTHRYFTASACALRDGRKQHNIQTLMALRDRCRARQCDTVERGAQDMISTAEKVAILRTVSWFAETPDEILAELATLLKLVEFQPGETIFHKGDCGDCMYIVVTGRVRVHDGERTLNYLGAGDVFGEMAILDAEPRVASVMTEEGVRLLQLDQKQFYDLMASRAEVARGVIRVLNRRLRARVRDMAQDFEFIQQMLRITAAAGALEAGVYDPCSLDEVGRRTDELGQLARVFQRMANEVQAREQRLKQEVQQLRIQIDETKKAREVAQITESDYFQHLQQRVKEMRRKGREDS